MKKFLLALILALSATAALADAPVILRAATEVDRPAIRLSDVFDNLPSGKDQDIAVAPAPGKSVTYDLRVLTTLAQTHSLDWKPQGMTDQIVLTRAATHVTPEMIEGLIKQKVKLAEVGKFSSIEITFDSKNVGLMLAANEAPNFDLGNFSYDAQLRRFRTDVVAQTAHGRVQQSVSGRVIIKREVPVLARRLPSGTVVSASDLAWISVNDERINEGVITSADQIVGRELRHDHGEGDLIRSRDVVAQRLVLRGNMVTMKVEAGALLITAQGRAMQDGAKGDVVRVMNLQSNRLIEGIVESSGIVRIGGGPQKLALAE